MNWVPGPANGWMDDIIALVLFVIQLAGILLALRAILEARTPQSAIGWTLGLVLLPILAIPLYLVFGQSKFSGYELSGQGRIPELDRIKHQVKIGMESARAVFPPHYQDLTHLSERLTGLPATEGNQLELLIDGEQTFKAIFDALDRAQNFIVVQFYIIHDDGLGRKLQEHLLRARQRGVAVYVMYDGVGSKHLPPSYVDRLRRAGVRVASFVTNRELGVRFQINFRNHRKLVVVDGVEAFTGGLNAGDEYMGLSPRFGPWRDTHLRLRGPGLLPLLLGFFEDWHYATAEVLDLPVVEPPQEGPSRVLSFVSGPSDEVEVCPAVYLSAIVQARRRIWIASPYFVPDSPARVALQHAALRGVDVRVLLPGMADHTLPWLSSFSYYPAMRQAGVRLYRMEEGFMHQKVLLVDNDLALVGSINFDHRSFLLNFEHGVLVQDEEFALRVQQMLQHDFSRSREENLSSYETRGFWFRLKVRLATLTAAEQ